MNTTDVNIFSLMLGGTQALGGNQLATSGLMPGVTPDNSIADAEMLLLGLAGDNSPLSMPAAAEFDVVLGKLLDQRSETAQMFDLPSLASDSVDGEVKTTPTRAAEISNSILSELDQNNSPQSEPLSLTVLSPTRSVDIDTEIRIVPNDNESFVPTGVRPSENLAVDLVDSGSVPAIRNEVLLNSESSSPVPLSMETQGNVLTIENAEPYMILPRSAVVQPEPASPTPGIMRSSLPDGQYQVQNWFVEGDIVHLDVATPGKPESMVRISIPLDQLTSAKTTTSGQSAIIGGQPRVTLDGTGQNNLTDLLSKYDIKEVHLATVRESSDSPRLSTPEQETAIKIVAQNTGQELVIKANLSRYALSMTDAPSAVRKQLVSTEPELSGRTETTPTRTEMAARPVLTSIPPALAGNSFLDEMILNTGKYQSSKIAETLSPTMANHTDESLDVLPAFTRTITDLTLPREKVDLQPVRFVIPENLQARLKPNGQSIRLHLEPDNLGPARMSLHLQNNRLRAVIVVETTQAKMAVEGSLERLLTALDKADIQVDRIDVNVDQQNTREQLFRQQHRTAPGLHSGRPFSINDELENAAEHHSVTPSLEPSYVGSDGVNLLA